MDSSVTRLVAVRLLLLVPVALGVVTLTFLVSRVLAPEPIELYLPPQADEQLRADMRERFGLDKPIGVQYVTFLQGVAVGDLGRSNVTGRPVTSDLFDRLPATAELALLALAFGTLLGVPLGIMAAVKRDGPLDFAVRGITITGMAVPAFWLGLIFILLFFVVLDWAPGPVGRFPVGRTPVQGPSGFLLLDSLLHGDLASFGTALRHLVLPALTLGVVTLAPITRVARTATVEVLESEYIRAARAMGIGRRTIYFRYVLKNTLLPVVTLVGTLLGALVSGSVLVEAVFNWPGVGLYALRAIQQSDFIALQGFVIWASLAYVVAYLLVDLVYLAVDPRIRAQ